MPSQLTYETAATKPHQRILRYVKRHGWAWDMAQIDRLFDQVLLSTEDEYNEFVQAECLCHLQWPLEQFRYYDLDVWTSGRPAYFTGDEASREMRVGNEFRRYLN